MEYIYIQKTLIWAEQCRALPLAALNITMISADPHLHWEHFVLKYIFLITSCVTKWCAVPLLYSLLMDQKTEILHFSPICSSLNISCKGTFGPFAHIEQPHNATSPRSEWANPLWKALYKYHHYYSQWKLCTTEPDLLSVSGSRRMAFRVKNKPNWYCPQYCVHSFSIFGNVYLLMMVDRGWKKGCESFQLQKTF